MKYYWTSCGSRRTTGEHHFHAHQTKDDADYHYDLMKTLGGNFDTICRSKLAYTPAEVEAHLQGIVNTGDRHNMRSYHIHLKFVEEKANADTSQLHVL